MHAQVETPLEDRRSQKEELPSYEELQHLRQHAEGLARSRMALSEQVAALERQLESAGIRADAHTALQERCADLQQGLEESARVQETQYSTLQQERTQLQGQLDVQVQHSAGKMLQQQSKLAAALEGMQAAEAAQQRLQEDNHALLANLSALTAQSEKEQGDLHASQEAAGEAETKASQLFAIIEAMQVELADQHAALHAESALRSQLEESLCLKQQEIAALEEDRGNEGDPTAAVAPYAVL